jgi:fructose-1,6-bisphosphatase/inositol monophosphatase family enzyme
MTLLGSHRLQRTLEVAVGAAIREVATRVIMPAFQSGVAIDAIFKAPGEAVTVVDRQSEEFLAERLLRILPGVKVVGEEAVHQDPTLLDHLARGACWIIDPLDGTNNYIAGREPFGVLVALACDGLPVAGWILDPVSGRLCSAIAGQGARMNGSYFRVSAHAASKPRVGLTKLFHDTATRAAIMNELAHEYTIVDAPRCAADIYPRVAQGALDAAMFTRTIAWDHAAGVLFLNEAGGCAKRPDGEEYHCSRSSDGLIAARSPAQWCALARILVETEFDLQYVQG